MALTLAQLSDVLRRYLLPDSLARVLGLARERQWEIHSEEKWKAWIVDQIEKERGELPDALKCEIQEKAECPVCKSPVVVAEAKRCAKCGTAHHEDCFAFARVCAIYGCGERTSS